MFFSCKKLQYKGKKLREGISVDEGDPSGSENETLRRCIQKKWDICSPRWWVGWEGEGWVFNSFSMPAKRSTSCSSKFGIWCFTSRGRERKGLAHIKISSSALHQWLFFWIRVQADPTTGHFCAGWTKYVVKKVPVDHFIFYSAIHCLQYIATESSASDALLHEGERGKDRTS